MARRRPDERSLVPIVDRMVDQRYAVAVENLSRLRAEFPTASTDELADRLIRRCARDLAMGGAMSWAPAASPVAGAAVVAASAGADATWSMGRLSEMIMALGLLYGHEHPTAEERAGWVWAVLGLSEGAAVGLTGIAARVGARGGARLLSRLPTGTQAATNATMSRKVMSKLSTGKGPWSLAALVPYGIGAGVGAAGNAVLAQSVGRAAKQYFAAEARDPAAVAGAPSGTSGAPGTPGTPGENGGAGPEDPPVVVEEVDGEIVDEVVETDSGTVVVRRQVVEDAIIVDPGAPPPPT